MSEYDIGAVLVTLAFAWGIGTVLNAPGVVVFLFATVLLFVPSIPEEWGE